MGAQEADGNSGRKRKNMDIGSIDRSRMVVFDVETTGLHAGFDEMLQFSVCDGNGVKLLDTYIRPIHMKAWPSAQRVNGISPEMVADAPTAEDLREQIQAIFNKAELLVSYNGSFDIGFLRAAGVDPTAGTSHHYDVMKRFSEVYGEWNDYFGDYKWQKLTTAAAYYDYDWSQHKAHDSMGDVYATLYVFNHMICGK